MAITVSPTDVYEALSEELRYWKRKYGTQLHQLRLDDHYDQERYDQEDCSEKDMEGDIQVCIVAYGTYEFIDIGGCFYCTLLPNYEYMSFPVA